MSAQNVIVALVTVPNKAEATKLAELLVEKRAAACVNIIPGLMSIFSWDGALSKEEEFLLIVKSVKSEYQRLEDLIKANHPYDCPEVLAFDAVNGAEQYCSWVNAQTSP
jgi:periplasmic divalent cation tolerance protein